ncbi:hypothetical protein BT93_K2241 [Corymbia citriodora subsp. variegata]|nr:hypothetical protein BT93_K2241 [Corymbia citriodora subsp. variegata]
MVSYDERLMTASMGELWEVSQCKVAPFHGNFQKSYFNPEREEERGSIAVGTLSTLL